ncbi:RING-H2 finger protein ATL58-like [Curcuma longa]|uniref:RING-H2 finger protein ATL58-like n=1 Tax=Curcuma longa TaxID=136217 RepID=UPI003D9DCB65
MLLVFFSSQRVRLVMSCASSNPSESCSAASPELKLYQAFIFSVPVFFTFVLLLLFYLFYLQRRRAHWQSLRLRDAQLSRGDTPRRQESGIKKELREMLPVVVFKESFLIRETQCSVCLGDYQSDDRLQRIPHCGHTFHVDCIDHWLASNTTCPLCRVSLLPTTKFTSSSLDHTALPTEHGVLDPQPSERLTYTRFVSTENEAFDAQRNCVDELVGAWREVEQHTNVQQGSVAIVIEASSSV